MKATEAKLLQILGAVSQFIIPIYQRTYSWTLKECQQLWADILRAGSTEEIGVHFIGSVVHIDEGLGNLAVQAPKLVIDGQQRLTTVTLLLTALADVLSELPEERQEPFDGFAPAKIRQYYLTNPLEKGDRRFKLLLSDTDRVTLMALVVPSAAVPPPDPSIRIQENHQFFLEQLRHPATDLVVVCRGISKLLVVDVALSRDQDNPQLIFESMNSTGRELSQADLIRNFVLMGQPPDLQERLYTLHWRPMELAFGQEAYSGNEFSAFMRDFLTLQTGEVPLLDQVYDTFKAYARRPEIEQGGTVSLLEEVHAVAGRYCRIVLAKEPDPALHQAFLNLRELKVSVVNPLLLELYGDHEAGLLSRSEFLEALQLLESYVFRRAVCAIPSNSQQKTFATFSRSLRKENGHYLPSFKAHLLSLPSYRRFPSDEEFRREIQLRNLYKFNKSCSYWLRKLENHQRKEPIAVANYTIEHILIPQAKRLLLTLNMPYAELDDPDGVARNLAGMHHWGNGEAELGVATLDEVPYAIGLIRQSLERQLDDNSAPV
jgi:uncharacterized protein with ParB-like and HNH nuclease domain/predicted transport protein